MKKRLLITSIVMMLVVAVALSTATYAWFTSNARVDAASMTLTADTSSATALGIGWADGEASTSISSNVSGVLSPMAPTALTIGTTTAGSGASDITFFSQTTKQEDSQFVFNGAGSAATPITYTNGSATAFYLKNLSNANTISSITVSAVFAVDGTNIDGKTYTYAPSTSMTEGQTYYVRSGSAPSYVYTAHTLAAADFTAATGTYVAGTAYFSKASTTYTAVDTSAFVVSETNVSSYYTATATYYSVTEGDKSTKNADDMIRVAIFRKTSAASGNGYEYATGDYKLIGVLGKTKTTYAEVTSASFDKNATYYTRTGSGTTESPYVYTQSTVTASNYATKEATGDGLFTAVNTAVYGSIAENGAVKDLSNCEITNSLELLVDNQALGSGKVVELMAVVWLDGTVFDDTRAGDIGSVSLKFNA